MQIINFINTCYSVICVLCTSKNSKIKFKIIAVKACKTF